MQSLLDTVSVAPHTVLDGAGSHAANVFLPLDLALLDSLESPLPLLEVLGLVHVDHLVDFPALVLDLIINTPVTTLHLVALVADVLLLGLPHHVELGSVHLLCHGYVLSTLT